MNTHLKQLWAAMKLPKNFKKSYKFFCLGLDIRVAQIMEANPAQTVLFQQLWKACRHGIRLDQVAHCIHKYITHRRKTINTVDSLLDSVDRKSEGR